jgi:hypothetical protein
VKKKPCRASSNRPRGMVLARGPGFGAPASASSALMDCLRQDRRAADNGQTRDKLLGRRNEVTLDLEPA